MSLFDDDRPKKQPVHEIGCDLSLLSADELSLRIDMLKQEIARLEAERANKSASKSQAEKFFRS
ncbi:DUF1192 domain-containing protein [Rhizobium giardinii]|jgi:uncharacterized small protein (DUF1192 family)|uniref:Uncharacterized small protein (DUF1192 family) n=1 Tax=Rhizobium giardinii TaxID=56731 RepID=A0A7W8U9H6_9HYPH|nr:DUF1192 domain-containing protein [Rhizobium giardinii]MBB5535306.1 uncharacterized small protein (DUF1192 family) [Rhizobium giardinii]